MNLTSVRSADAPSLRPPIRPSTVECTPVKHRTRVRCVVKLSVSRGTYASTVECTPVKHRTRVRCVVKLSVSRGTYASTVECTPVKHRTRVRCVVKLSVSRGTYADTGTTSLPPPPLLTWLNCNCVYNQLILGIVICDHFGYFEP